MSLVHLMKTGFSIEKRMDVVGSSLMGAGHTQTAVAVAHTTPHAPPDTDKSFHHKGSCSRHKLANRPCQKRRWNSLLARDQQLLGPVGGFCKRNLDILWDQLQGEHRLRICALFVLRTFDGCCGGRLRSSNCCVVFPFLEL